MYDTKYLNEIINIKFKKLTGHLKSNFRSIRLDRSVTIGPASIPTPGTSSILVFDRPALQGSVRGCSSKFFTQIDKLFACKLLMAFSDKRSCKYPCTGEERTEAAAIIKMVEIFMSLLLFQVSCRLNKFQFGFLG